MALMFMIALVPAQAQADDTPTATIQVDWTQDGFDITQNAYRVIFGDNGTYGVDITLEHSRNGTLLPSSSTMEWKVIDDRRVADVQFNTSLEWGDELNVRVDIQTYNGAETDVLVERMLTVGRWNQPMADHEVMLSTSWELEQAYNDSEGEQRFGLAFNGQGWQERVGETLRSWELGNGTFQTLETLNGSETDLHLVLTQLWKNETVVGGVLTQQVFDARGFGDLQTTVVDGETITVINADVSQAQLNRSFNQGVIGERLLLEATGTLNLSEESDEDSSLNIDGELAVYFFEYHDVDGERILQHTQFEAMADFILIEDGTRLDVSLDGFTTTERWEDGVRTEHLEELYGQGTFGFEDDDENASVQVNATIHDIHSKIENGNTTIDDLHVDGTLTGDVQGTFGIVRGIEETGMQTNATGDPFLVNVIFQESWFNITGVNGGNFFDGAGVGATHNETWDYQTVQADWENRTVRLVWRETGPDASEGEEFPPHSPIQRNATPPASEEGLGDVTVGRETGWMPIPLQEGDELRLNGQEGITLDVVAGGTSIDTRDGHNLSVIGWTGTYGGSGESGQASGTIVSVGPLKGLITSVQRSLSLPFGEENETITLQESQVLERVLSPSIVSADDNSAPVILELGLREGLVIGEGGSIAHLEVVVEDAEWNVVEVSVDLAVLGGGVVVLNDRGLDGDDSIGDDVYTTTLLVPGLDVGEVSIPVSAKDSFGAQSSSTGQVTVVNQAPRLLDVELAPASLERGQSAVVNVNAYDGHGVASLEVDLRSYGGVLTEMVETDGTWAAMIVMPDGMTPGEQSLLLIATDSLGATEQYRAYAPSIDQIGHDVFGIHHVNTGPQVDIAIFILNDRPTLNAPSATVVKQTNTPSVYTAEAQDPDGIERLQIDLGVYAPVGSSSWVLMHDDGISGGDEIAGDGVYSVLLSVREGTPLGNHEVFLRSFDTYGELNTTSTTISLVLPDVPLGSEGGLSVTVLGAVGAVIFIGAAIVLGLMWRKQDGGEGGSMDRFGSQ